MQRWIRPAAAVLLTTTSAAAFAAEVRRPQDSAMAALTLRHPDLYIKTVYQPPSALAPAVHPGLQTDLLSVGLSEDRAFYDRRGGRWGTLLPSRPLLPGPGKGNMLSWGRAGAPVKGALKQAAWDAFTAYLTANQAVLRLDPREMTPRVTVHEGGRLVQIHAARVVGSVPVRGAYVSAVLNAGNLVLLGSRNWGNVEVGTRPVIGAEAAEAAVAAHVRGHEIAGRWQPTHLEMVVLANGADESKVVPGSGYRHRLVWVVSVTVGGDSGRWEALVDAGSGQLLAFQDHNQYEERNVQGGVLPVSNDGQVPDGVEQPGFPMPFADVQAFGTSAFTNSSGLVPDGIGSSLRTTLTGRYVHINDHCGPINEGLTCGSLDLGTSSGTDCAVPTGSATAGNTHSARSGFYEVNRIVESARAWLPGNTWLQQRITANMNINDSCNAFWDGSTINFYRSGAGCANTGELAGVFDHEWAHGLDDNNANPDISSPGESIADIHAILRLNTSCVGRGFFGTDTCSGYGDACTQCTGIREVDFAKRASGQPHGIDWVLSPTVAPGGGCLGVVGVQFGPCNQETHCEGIPPAEAIWDLWNRDLPAGGLDANTSLEVATRLTFVGANNIGNWYQCIPGPSRLAGCNADGGYLNYLATDDDNGDLADGTPHMSAIFAAFDRHQIACGTPAVVNSGCGGGPSQATGLSATALPRGVQLSWNAVPGATRYWVYRTEGVHGCDFGKVKIAEVTSTEFTDTGLLEGFTYFHSVQPVGAADACMGPMAACTSTVPLAPAPGPSVALAFQEQPDALAILSGDGDPFLDNCETARFRFRVENAGTVPLHNVRVVAVERVSHPATTLLTPLPVAVAATLSAGCGAAGSAASGEFAFVPRGVGHDEAIVLRIHVTADELPAPLVGTFTVEGTESDYQALASKTFGFEQGFDGWRIVSDVYTRQSPGANGTLFHLASSSAEPGHCDRIQSPRMILGPTSTLSLFNQFAIEPGTPVLGFYDRANVGVLDVATGGRTTVSPDGGRTYTASGGGGVCVTAGEAGWAGLGPGFLPSTWTASALKSPQFAGRQVKLDVAYGTDPAVELAGFQFDEVTVSNLQLQVLDASPDACTGPAPLLARDDTATTTVATPVQVNVLANDTSGTPPLTVTQVGAPAHGTSANNGNGTVTYTPDPSHAGSDTFTYRVCDGASACATARVSVTIQCNPTPTASFSDDFEPAPQAGWSVDTAVAAPGSTNWTAGTDLFAHSPSQAFSSDGTTLVLKDDRLVAPPQDVSSTTHLVFWHRFGFENTFDGGVLEVSRDGGATWVDVLAGGGSFVQGGYNGSVAPNFGSPIAGRAAWTGFSQFIDAMTRVEVDLGAFAGSGVRVRWRLAADPFAAGALPGLGWWIDDVELTNTLETPNECPLPPNAADDRGETRQGTPVVIDVLANDTDGNGDALTITSVSVPAHGTAANNGDGTITYTPQGTFVGTDAFTYTVSDGQGGSDTATVTVTVTANPTTSGQVKGDGWIPRAGGGKSHFGFDARVSQGVAKGRLSYDCSQGGGLCLKGKVDSLSLSGSTATFGGTCELADGRSCTYSVTAQDLGDPGAGRDTFAIQVRNGLGALIHQASGPLGGGNIKIRP